jgi:hypothetical protein
MINTRNIEFVEGVFEETHYTKQSGYPYVAFSEEEEVFLYSNREYVVTFKNYNDDVLYQTTVNAGENVVYEGIIPRRAGFLFSGWNKNISHKIYRDTVFTAVFTEIAVEEAPLAPPLTPEGTVKPLPLYEIQFMFDGSIIKTDYVTKGLMPSPPSIISGSIVNIVNLTWDKEIVPATENTIYTVKTYDEEYRMYIVTFKKPNNEILKQYDSVIAGTLLSDLPEFNDPSSSVNEEHYNCIGWINTDGNVVNNKSITSDITLIAVYEPKKYTIEFWIFGEILISSQEVEYNTMPVPPMTYYRSSDNCTFEILSWDPDPVVPAVADARYNSNETIEYSGVIM